MSGHTKGPWHIANGVQIRSDKHQIAKVWMFGCGEGKANANLISAAPELLEALALCLVQLEKEHMPSDEVMHAMHHARAAICKAVPTSRGEE